MAHKRWLPLEANPDVINNFCDALGLDTQRSSFNEVYGVDPEMLAFVPTPVYAVILLFPIEEATERFREEERIRIEDEGQTVSPNVYFMKQTVGNACGTIAILHSILNHMDVLSIRNGSFLKRFYERTSEMTPGQIADFLENPKEDDPDIEEAHRTAAESGETQVPPLEQRVNLHYVCLTEKDGVDLSESLFSRNGFFEGGLYELDGRKEFPIYHGTSSPGTVLQDAIKVTREFMARTSSIEFNIMALCGQ